MSSDPRTRVLLSVREPKPSTNPYIVQLVRGLRGPGSGVDVLAFSWPRALRGGYDVVHLHWPEVLIEGRSPLRRAVRRALLALWLLRLAVSRTAVVRTWHNLERPEGLAKVDHVLLGLVERSTSLVIRINDSGPTPRGRESRTILHSDYEDWYAGLRREQPVAGRLAFVGLVRRYKGVENLLQCFAEVEGENLSLEVSGRPTSGSIAAEIEDLARQDARVHLDLRFLDDADYVAAVTRAGLVVLPYRHMHNSGSVLAALSLGRPVLVPENEVNLRLAEEVGDGWVLTYRGELDPDDLTRAVRLVKHAARSAPDLSRRRWDDAVASHVEAYAAAIRVGPPRRRRLAA